MTTPTWWTGTLNIINHIITVYAQPESQNQKKISREKGNIIRDVG